MGVHIMETSTFHRGVHKVGFHCAVWEYTNECIFMYLGTCFFASPVVQYTGVCVLVFCVLKLLHSRR